MDLSLTHITSTAAVSIALAVITAFLVHWALYAIALRLVRQRMDPVLLPALFQPTRWLVVLLALVSLAGILAYLPMPAMAALLIMVAWNMSEAPKAVHLLKTAPRSDVLVFFTCFGLTVALDMVIAITTGVLLAAVLFMREMAQMTKVTDISDNKRVVQAGLPKGWRVFKINGPLFFAAADRVFGELADLSRETRGFVLYMDGVTVLDAGGLAALNKLIDQCRKNGTEIMIADLQFQPLRALARAGLKPEPGVSSFYPSLAAALETLNTRRSAPQMV